MFLMKKQNILILHKWSNIMSIILNDLWKNNFLVLLKKEELFYNKNKKYNKIYKII
jgi:hypothetical protein